MTNPFSTTGIWQMAGTVNAAAQLDLLQADLLTSDPSGLSHEKNFDNELPDSFQLDPEEFGPSSATRLAQRGAFQQAVAKVFGEPSPQLRRPYERPMRFPSIYGGSGMPEGRIWIGLRVESVYGGTTQGLLEIPAESTITIGSHPGSDIWLNDPDIAPQAAQIEMRDGKLYLVPMQGAVSIGDMLVVDAQPLEGEDDYVTIQVGNWELHIRVDWEDIMALPQPPPPFRGRDDGPRNSQGRDHDTVRGTLDAIPVRGTPLGRITRPGIGPYPRILGFFRARLALAKPGVRNYIEQGYVGLGKSVGQPLPLEEFAQVAMERLSALLGHLLLEVNELHSLNESDPLPPFLRERLFSEGGPFGRRPFLYEVARFLYDLFKEAEAAGIDLIEVAGNDPNLMSLGMTKARLNWKLLEKIMASVNL